MQTLFQGEHAARDFIQQIKKCSQKLFVVCGTSCGKLSIAHEIQKAFPEAVYFNRFTPNPSYDSVAAGILEFRENSCDAVLAIGGGSALDVAKCIKLYALMDTKRNLLEQAPEKNAIPLFAVPTTAGTGSEATHFAVIYYHGEKQSVSHDSIIPQYVLLCPRALNALSDYQRKSTMSDALCHAVESFWSIHSTEQSRKLSEQAIKMIFTFKDSYLKNEEKGNQGMLHAANIAGQAINITQTTAAHAMCYKLTSLCGLAHGHAAALCLPVVWEQMAARMEQCTDSRGRDFLQNVFHQIAVAMGCQTPKEAIKKLEAWNDEAGFQQIKANEHKLDEFVKSVNADRLKNNPVKLTENDIRQIYQAILVWR